MTDRNTLDALQETAVRETLADGTEVVTADADALAAHIDSHGPIDRDVDPDTHPVLQDFFADIEQRLASAKADLGEDL